MFTFDSIPRMQSMVDIADIKSGKAFKVLPGTHARAIQEFYRIVLPHIAAVDGRLWMVNQTRSRIEMTNEAAAAAKGYSTVTNLNYSLPGGKANRFAVGVMMEAYVSDSGFPVCFFEGVSGYYLLDRATPVTTTQGPA